MASREPEEVSTNFYTPENAAFYAAEIYKPLDLNTDTLRLLELHPGSGDDDGLKCTMVEPPASQELKYECVSYRAGDPTDTVRIEVSGHAFNAFATLGAALRKLRLPDQGRIVWADQICVNQSDVAERSSQVAQMRGFYERAEGVVAWLGCLERGDVAVRVMRVLSSEYDQRCRALALQATQGRETKVANVWDIVRSMLPLIMEQLVQTDQNGVLSVSTGFEALRELFSSELWNRLWIWQELVVSAKIRFEWDTNSVEYFVVHTTSALLVAFFAMRWTYPMGEISGAFASSHLDGTVSNIEKVLKLFNRRNKWKRDRFLDLKSLLRDVPSAKCTDPRDRVFALSGLVNASYNIVPQYTDSVQQTYYKAAVAILLLERSLDILGSCRHPRHRDPTSALPSWCPDWSMEFDTAEQRMGLLWDEFHAPESGFQASKLALAAWRTVPGEMQSGLYPHISLFVHGLLIGRVQEVGAMSNHEHWPEDEGFDALLKLWSKTVAQHRTLTEAVLKELEETATVDYRSFVTSGAGNEVNDASNCGRLMSEATCGLRRFFITNNGAMRMRPPHVQADDLVCVLLGARVPFLLRKQDGFYTLVGEAYASDGYMIGRAIDEMKVGELTTQEFEIR